MRFSNLADAAEYIASEKDLIKSFNEFHDGTRNWIYSLNSDLADSISRPKQFAKWDDWHTFSQNQKRFLCELGGVDDRRIAEVPAVLAKLKAAYGMWPPAYRAIYWGGGSAHHSSCNIFVGECLALCGYGRQAAPNGKYLSAQSYWMGHNSFVREVSQKMGTVKRGMIMSVNYGGGTFHLEIITKPPVREEHWFGDDDFRFSSRGGGRGRGYDGQERNSDVVRLLGNEKLKIFRLLN
jgi:hypothetical protein